MSTLRVGWADRDRLTIVGLNGASALGSTQPGEVGLSPLELLASAVGTCLAITLRGLMERRGLDPTRVSLAVTWSKAERPSRVSGLEVVVDFGQPVEDAQAAALLAAAERGCTVSNTLKQAASVTLTRSPGNPPSGG